MLSLSKTTNSLEKNSALKIDLGHSQEEAQDAKKHIDELKTAHEGKSGLLQTQLAEEQERSSVAVAEAEAETRNGEEWKRKYQQLADQLAGLNRGAQQNLGNPEGN